ncbi:ankyrin repeat domain-containing protein [Shewanella sp. 202IG2-18]|uniref:ankyrin repeat domain-containing protein n=1 Tax=Parashewanella hymeniacidonis TaxID=2807618 RepID=UPI0019605D67|nr:ankyrin repeat domain-containing protein [Parashewanella hymeniacidonis]MBM7071660.1 ankyrin repeat domain-containing protein [Parashewanella hymeniacidonis]
MEQLSTNTSNPIQFDVHQHQSPCQFTVVDCYEVSSSNSDNKTARSLSYITANHEPRAVVVKFHNHCLQKVQSFQKIEARLEFVPKGKLCWKIAPTADTSESLKTVKVVCDKLNLMGHGSEFIQSILKGNAQEVLNYIKAGFNVNCVLSNENFNVSLEQAESSHGFQISHNFINGQNCDCGKWLFSEYHYRASECKNGVKHAKWGYDSRYEHEELLSQGLTPLHIAIYCDHKPVVLELTKAGARPNIRDKNGQTAIHLLAELGFKDLSDPVISSCKDNDIDIKDDSGNTALHIAVYKHNRELCKKIIEAGSCTSIVNHKGLTPLMVAIKKQNKEIVELFLPNIEVGKPLHTGESVLQVAVDSCRPSHYELIDLLLEHGADPFFCSDMSKSAILGAVSKKDVKLLTKLLSVNSKDDAHIKVEHLKAACKKAIQLKDINAVNELLKYIDSSFFDENVLDILDMAIFNKDIEMVTQCITSIDKQNLGLQSEKSSLEVSNSLLKQALELDCDDDDDIHLEIIEKVFSVKYDASVDLGELLQFAVQKEGYRRLEVALYFLTNLALKRNEIEMLNAVLLNKKHRQMLMDNFSQAMITLVKRAYYTLVQASIENPVLDNDSWVSVSIDDGVDSPLQAKMLAPEAKMLAPEAEGRLKPQPILAGVRNEDELL